MMMDIERMKKEIDEWYNSKAYDKWCERLLFIDKLRELDILPRIELNTNYFELAKYKLGIK